MINQELSNFSKDSKTYTGDYDLLKTINVKEGFQKDGKTTVADYIDFKEI